MTTAIQKKTTCNKALLRSDILRVHVEDAGFLAALIRRAVDGPNCRLIDMYDFESRLDAHLGALFLNASAATVIANELLSVEAGYGEVFTCGYLALRTNDSKAITHLIGLSENSMDSAQALAMAASYCVPSEIGAHVRQWLRGTNPTAAWIALELCGLRRIDPGNELTRLVSSTNKRVAARAFQLAAELGRIDLIQTILAKIAENGIAGFWAAWAACLLGDRDEAPTRLAAVFRSKHEKEPGMLRMAAELLPIISEQDHIQDLIRQLLSNEETRRWAIVALGSLGSTPTLDWLIQQMDDPKQARIAGASFVLATGSHLGANNLELDEFPDRPDNSLVETDPQEGFIENKLYWPDREKVKFWLDANRGRFQPDTRHLLGQAAWTHLAPPSQPAKYQLEFRAVALEIALRSPNTSLPNWRAPVVLSGGQFTRRW